MIPSAPTKNLRYWIALGIVAGLALATCSTTKEQQREPATVEPVVNVRDGAIRIVLGGDVMFGRWHDNRWEGYHRPETLAAFDELTNESDLTMVNLESALCQTSVAKKHHVRKKYIQLTTPPEAAARLHNADVDIATVANNHALDCGPGSIGRTKRGLAEQGIASRGVLGDDSDFLKIGETRVAILAATVLPPTGDPTDGNIRFVQTDAFDAFVEDVEKVRSAHPDALLVVSLHWGAELKRGASHWQKQRARELVEAGADIVHGHGSHVVQSASNRDGAAIAYSTGNLHFDMRNESTLRRAAFVVTCSLDGERECSGELRDFDESLVEAANSFPRKR